MKSLIINLSRVTQHVGIIDSKGRKATFRLMARGRVKTNYDVDPNWLARNRSKIKVVALKTPVETTTATDKTASTASTSTVAASKTTTAVKSTVSSTTSTVTSTASNSAAPTVATSIASESTTAEGAK
jgi:hypothetical protein